MSLRWGKQELKGARHRLDQLEKWKANDRLEWSHDFVVAVPMVLTDFIEHLVVSIDQKVIDCF